ncbi:hypothetical protein [Faecalibaculum rodentium]|uniref:hypothetical protein n=1 Tax=Faecalibaculum rodentium TaxID=1702221 RepID=UPI0023F2A4E8|nr:hypothetical protein [Faecalibaculum rodentium]
MKPTSTNDKIIRALLGIMAMLPDDMDIKSRNEGGMFQRNLEWLMKKESNIKRYNRPTARTYSVEEEARLTEALSVLEFLVKANEFCSLVCYRQ